MSERAPYSRVYWTILDDPKFDDIRVDFRHLGVWTLLLIVADMAWPAPAFTPPGIPKACLRALTDAGLVDLLTGGRFRIHGLATERGRRSNAATASANARWSQSERAPDAIRPQSERMANGLLDETRRDEDETRRDDARESLPGYDGRADLEAYLLVTRRAPTVKQRRLLDMVLDIHDLTGPQWAADIILSHPEDPIGAVIAADKAWRAERIAEARAAEKPKPAPRKHSGLTGINAELATILAAQYAEETP